MRTQGKHFELPGKIDRYLATLNRLYQREGEHKLREIIVNGEISIHEEWDYDNWDGGTYGHAITLTVQEELFLDLVNERDRLQTRLREDINKLDNTQNEHVSEVFIEMEMTEQDQWREESGVLRPRIAPISIPPDAMSRIWGVEHVRVFISHKDNVKIQAAKLKEELASCGISGFVAHEDIEPTEDWRKEIESALFSMDVLVALLAEEFHDSEWTDQEVGVALGRGVPLIAVRLGLDPYGLMGKRQGLGGCSWDDIPGMAARIFDVLYRRFPDRSRLFKSVVTAYASSVSFADSAWKVRYLLTKFDSLTADQTQQVIDAYMKNDQNRKSFEGQRYLKPLLEKWTGKRWKLENDLLVPEVQELTLEDDLPF